MTDVPINRGNLDIETGMQGGWQCEEKKTKEKHCKDKGRDWSDASKNQRILANYQKLGESYGTDFTSHC